jgi:hypothetical protein
MQNWQPENPVERRLLAAHEDWLAFAKDPSARLLYWHTNAADQELVKLYFQGQSELSNAVLELTSPFEDARQYATALADEVIDFYDARREGSARSGIVADWTPPSRHPQSIPATHYFADVLDSLMAHHPDVFPAVVLVLKPAQIRKVGDFEQWLDAWLTLMNTGSDRVSSRIRVVLYGTEADALAWLASRQPGTVRVLNANYRMQALPRELVAQSGERGATGQFRRLFVELSECLAHEDPARLERLRASALAISDGHQWFDQSATVHLLAGAAYLKWQSGEPALQAYRQAISSGRCAVEAQHPAGNKLVVNGLFGEASVHVTEERYLDAAQCYASAARFAAADNDSVLLVESYRMQAWCLDHERHREDALEAGFHALQAGRDIDLPLRSNSNLQLAATWMLERIGRLHARRGELERTLGVLYGDQWKEALRQPLAPDEVSMRLIESNDKESKNEDRAS